MTLVSATVESNGWVLALTGYWPQSEPSFPALVKPHADFPLEPEGPLPKLLVEVAGTPGHTRAGGEAVAHVWPRTLIGTKPLRRPWPDSTQLAPVLDEADLGDGLRRVRIALSDRVFAGETVQVRLRDGWRAGIGGGVFAAENLSARVPVPPICRWATGPYALVTGETAMRVDLLVASHYPRHHGAELHQAVAGVRFRVTDGQTVREQWVTAPSTSDAHPDGLRCWGTVLELAGLSAGVVSVSATVFPWIGAPREIGVGHQPNATAGFIADAETVLPICYDPDGARYGRRYVFVDAEAGVTVPADVTLADNLAAAKAGTAAASLSVALQAMFLANVALPPANGLSGGTRSCDWWEVVLAAGQVHEAGALNVSFGLGAKEGFLVVRGDPDDPDPRANCVLRAMDTTAPSLRNARWWFEDLRIELGGTPLIQIVGFTRINRVDVRGRPGFESSGTSLFSSGTTGQNGLGTFVATDFTWLAYGSGTAASSIRPLLMRAGRVAASRYHRGLCLVNIEAVRDPTVDYLATGSTYDFGGVQAESSGVLTADQIAWGLMSIHNNGRFYVPGAAEGSGVNGTEAAPLVYRRLAMVNCLCVRSGPNVGFKHIQIGENAWNRQEDCLWEGLTFVGQRTSFHNDPPNHDGDLVQTGVVVRNSFFDRIASKSDTFPTASANRLGSWELHYGVGFEGLVVGERGGNGGIFLFEFYGLKNYQADMFPGAGTASIAGFVDDQSNWGPHAATPGDDGVGPGVGGDYRPTAALMRRGVAGNVDVDFAGRARAAVPTVGIWEMEASGLELAPDAGLLAMRDGGAALAVRFGLRLGSGLMRISDAGAQLWAQGGMHLAATRGRRLRVRKEIRGLDAGNN